MVWLVAILVVAQLLYLIGGNWFLSPQRGPEWISRKPDRFQVSWEKAWTFWPGRVHMRGLRLRGQTPKQRWELGLDRARGSIALLDLTRRSFRVRRLGGDGAHFWLAKHGAGESADAAGAVSDQAPIVPLSLSGEVPQRSATRRAGKKPWRVQVQNVSVSGVRDLWLLRQRYQGDGVVHGAMNLRLRGPLSVERATLRLQPGTVSVGEGVAGRIESLNASVRISPFVVREHRGISALRFVSGSLRAEAPQADLGVVRYLFRGAPWLDLDGQGELELALFVDHGRLQPGSTAQAKAEVEVAYLDNLLAGESAVNVEVVREGEASAPEARVEALFPEFTVLHAGESEPHLFGAEGRVLASTTSLDLAEPSPELDAEIFLPNSRAPDLTIYNRFLPETSGFSILEGEGTVDGRLSLTSGDGGRLSGEIDLAGERIAARFNDMKFTGDLQLTAKIPEGNIEERRFQITGTRLEIDNATLDAGKEDEELSRWWAKVDLVEGQVELARPMRLLAALNVRLRDTGPLLGLIDKDDKRPVWLDNWLTMEGVAGTGALAVEERGILLNDLAIVAGNHLELQGNLWFAKPELRALFFCRYRKLSVSVEMEEGKRDWDLVGSRKWYEKRRLAWEDAQLVVPDLALSEPAAPEPVTSEPGTQ